jgi:predicted nucleic acid-binding protein
MKLSEIAPGSPVFIDANVPLAVIFKEQNAPLAREFLKRIESREIVGVTSVLVVNEVFHRSLIAEVCKLLQVRPPVALRKLKETPGIFQSLHESWKIVEDFLKLPIMVYQLDEDALLTALHLARADQLLSNDASHVALLARNGLQDMASFDRDFERVDFINVYGRE